MKRAPWKPVALLRSCQWTLSTETLVRRASHQHTLNITDRTSLHMTSSDSQRSNAESCPRPKRRRRGNRLAVSSSPLEPKSDCECSTTLAPLDLWRTLANTKKIILTVSSNSPRKTIATAQNLYHRFHLFFPRKDFGYQVQLDSEEKEITAYSCVCARM